LCDNVKKAAPGPWPTQNVRGESANTANVETRSEFLTPAPLSLLFNHTHLTIHTGILWDTKPNPKASKDIAANKIHDLLKLKTSKKKYRTRKPNLDGATANATRHTQV